MNNRTEVTPAQAETPTPKFQHLAPALAAQQAGVPGEEMVMAMVPRAFEITLSDGTRQRVKFEPGNYPIPARFKDHYYLKANGVTFGGEVKAAEKPQLEKGANPAAVAAAAEAEAQRIADEKAAANAVWREANGWPTDAALSDAKLVDLGAMLTERGVSEDDIKALTSKDGRRALILELSAKAQADAS